MSDIVEAQTTKPDVTETSTIGTLQVDILLERLKWVKEKYGNIPIIMCTVGEHVYGSTRGADGKLMYGTMAHLKECATITRDPTFKDYQGEVLCLFGEFDKNPHFNDQMQPIPPTTSD